MDLFHAYHSGKIVLLITADIKPIVIRDKNSLLLRRSGVPKYLKSKSTDTFG